MNKLLKVLVTVRELFCIFGGRHGDLVVMSRDHFLGMLRNHFDLNLVIMSELVQRMRDTNEQLSDLMFFDVRTRVIKLVKLANRFGERSEHSVVVKMPLDRHELFQMAGVKIRELNEVLSDLGERQLVNMCEPLRVESDQAAFAAPLILPEDIGTRERRP